MNNKQCNICNTVKPITEFYKQTNCKFGVTPVCKVCTNNKNKLWRDQHKEDSKIYFKERKRDFKKKIVDYLGGRCADCGLIDTPVVYDVHHINPQEKDRGLAELCGYSWSRIEQELKKDVVLLCSNCHRKRHFKEIKVGNDWGSTKEL